jgi:hypothetical protein
LRSTYFTYIPRRHNIMKKSLIWITAGVAAVGLGVPAFAAARDDAPRHDDPSQITTVTAAPITSAAANVVAATVTTTAGVEDVSGPCDEVEHATDPRCAGVSVVADDNSVTDNSVTDNSVTDNSVTDNSVTDNSVDDDDDATSNSVEDVSGPCDEAEHVNDARCTNAAAQADDNSGRGRDNSGRGSDDSGRGDDSGHGGNDD